jgi:uncharacterized protein (DUF433 family)
METQPLPLMIDDDGVVCVGGTRVTLGTVIAAFLEGGAPEEIVHQYPSLRLPDVYSGIAYYLKHRSEIDSYIGQSREQARVVREQNETLDDPHGIHDRLLTRKAAKEA